MDFLVILEEPADTIRQRRPLRPSNATVREVCDHCAGASLARLEIAALLKALIPRVQRFEVISEQRAELVTLRGWAHLHVQVT